MKQMRNIFGVNFFSYNLATCKELRFNGIMLDYLVCW